MPSPMSRRALILAGLALPFAPTPGWTAARPLTFAVFRNNAMVGEHRVEFTGDETALTARIDAAMTVRLGPVPVYRYRHTATERWASGRFVSLQTQTNGNGRKLRVVAEATAAGVTIESPSGKVRAPLGAAPLSHWNQAVLTGPLFNPQEGKLLKIRATRLGPGHWALRGEAEIDNWYDADGAWKALRGVLEDGSRMDYRRI
jgi:Family of unknown function (DUF6134)